MNRILDDVSVIPFFNDIETYNYLIIPENGIKNQ